MQKCKLCNKTILFLAYLIPYTKHEPCRHWNNEGSILVKCPKLATRKIVNLTPLGYLDGYKVCKKHSSEFHRRNLITEKHTPQKQLGKKYYHYKCGNTIMQQEKLDTALDI